MTSAKHFDGFSLVVTRNHSKSFVVTRGHSWSTRGQLVVIRGHSWSLVCTFRHDRLLIGRVPGGRQGGGRGTNFLSPAPFYFGSRHFFLTISLTFRTLKTTIPALFPACRTLPGLKGAGGGKFVSPPSPLPVSPLGPVLINRHVHGGNVESRY